MKRGKFEGNAGGSENGGGRRGGVSTGGGKGINGGRCSLYKGGKGDTAIGRKGTTIGRQVMGNGREMGEH